jgi:hypothetical protein
MIISDFHERSSYPDTSWSNLLPRQTLTWELNQQREFLDWVAEQLEHEGVITLLLHHSSYI